MKHETADKELSVHMQRSFAYKNKLGQKYLTLVT
jgi:hypothetical protein